MASQFLKTMTSFSGADLVVSFGPKIIGELQQISWGIQREKAPIYTLGNADPHSVSRGKRAIAGSLVFAVFNRDALLEELKTVWDDIAPKAMYTAAGNLAIQGSEIFENALEMSEWNHESENTVSITLDENGKKKKDLKKQSNGKATGTKDLKAVSAEKAPATSGDGEVYVPAGFGVIHKENILYADMLPPLDVTMTFANEYGQAAFQKIYDLDFLNEGSGVSVDSIVMERQMTWMARRISPILSGVYSRDEQGIVKGYQNTEA